MKAIAFINQDEHAAHHASALPNLDKAVAGDLLVAVNRTATLTQAQADTLFGALAERLPAGLAVEAFSAVRQPHGGAEVSLRGYRLAKPAALVNAVKAGLAHGVAGEVVDT